MNCSRDLKNKFYFVHSFYVLPTDENVIMSKTQYNINFVSSIRERNIIGVQFHPEKSHNYGLNFLQILLKYMLQNRIIPILTIINEDLVKTKMFDDPSYVGDPINAIKIFNEKFVDELILIDIGNESKTPNINFICDIASECFMPLTYGGKITSISQAEKIFNSGVEKFH